MTEPDEALVIRSRSGDRLAFEELIRRTGRLVFARLCLDTANAHEAEDLSQEPFLVAFRKIHSLSDAAAFRPWILAIAHSVLIDARRNKSRRKRKVPGSVSQELANVPDGSPSPPQVAERSDDRRRVLAMLRSMPEEYRQPLSLRYLTGADYEMIGRELGLTNGSLRGLLHRGLAMLRAKMGDE